MGKPNNIPQDVWDAAYAVAVLCGATLAVGAVEAIACAIMAERTRAAQACEEQAKAFLSPEYSYNQPLGSFCERFACEQCADAIRNPAQSKPEGEAA